MVPAKTRKRRLITAVDFGFGLGERLNAWTKNGKRARVVIGLEQNAALIRGPKRQCRNLVRRLFPEGTPYIPSLQVLRRLPANSVSVFNSNLTLFSAVNLRTMHACRPIVRQIYRVLRSNGHIGLTLESNYVPLAVGELAHAGFSIERQQPLTSHTAVTLLEKMGLHLGESFYHLVAIKRVSKEK